MTMGWPTSLLVVRHGESVGNAAAAAARRDGSEVIDVPTRDPDVDLTEQGARQAETIGRWLRGLPREEQPEIAVLSPYVRARRTASIALEELGEPVSVRVDERLRDRELGVLDRLTARGIELRHPDEAARRRLVGKFYHRPGGGESWADVLLRVRSALTDLCAAHAGRRVLIVTHDVVVLLIRYVLEDLDEDRVLEISRRTAPVNGGITHYQLDDDGGLVLRSYNMTVAPEGRLVGSDG